MDLNRTVQGLGFLGEVGVWRSPSMEDGRRLGIFARRFRSLGFPETHANMGFEKNWAEAGVYMKTERDSTNDLHSLLLKPLLRPFTFTTVTFRYRLPKPRLRLVVKIKA